MKTAKVSDKVYYIGVNDRTTQKFEGMWPLPNGVSYNSYLVVGEDKTAVIDGVEVSHALQQIDTIKSILGDREPDYLIINHMEPDHSSGIRLLRQAFPDIKIIGNQQTLGMVKGYYGVDDNAVALKDGETLTLGDSTHLRFIMTPMLHWPETMMTYLEEEKTMFSGDAFGCFGALNGAVIDKDMNTDRYFPEMLRYYSNIVGKYGAFVQKAFKKLEGVPVETICSTHGPVWREQIAKVLDLYDKLSRYEPLDNGVAIVYGSMYGNTERLAEAAAETLAECGVKEIEMLNASFTDLSYIIAAIFRHKGLILAAPTYSDTLFPPVSAVIESIIVRGIKNRQIALMGSHTWAHQATKVMSQRLDACGITCVTEPVVNKQGPDENDFAACRDMAKTLAETLK